MGKGYVDRWTIFENKYIGGIYFHSWHTIEQDRFHTHAFDGVAWLVCGSYQEEVLFENTKQRKQIKPGIRYIPKGYNHKILKAEPRTYSLLISGPWAKTWTEETDTWKRVLSWNRNVVKREVKDRKL